MLERSMPSESPLAASQEPADAELMRQLAEGKSSAMRELMRRHQTWVSRIAWRMTGNAESAQDIVQETFIRVFQSAGRYRPEAAFTTYLRKIVVNLAIDHRRAFRPTIQISQDSPDPPAAENQDPLVANERQQRVQKAIGALPARQRAALTLHRFENQSYREIAGIMDLSESAVESLVMRAYAALREALSDLCEKRPKD